MKRIILFTLAVFLLASCTSVPEKLSSDDCLVIMKTTVTKEKDSYKAGRSYSLKISNNDDWVKIAKDKDSFIYFVINNEDDYIEAMKSYVIGHNMSGRNSEFPVEIDLPYEPGKLIIADIGFDLKITYESSGTFMNEPGIFKLSEEEKEKLLRKIQGRGDFSSWF